MSQQDIISFKKMFNDLVDIDVAEMDDCIQVSIDTHGHLTTYVVEDGMLYVDASNDDYQDTRELFLDLNLDDNHIEASKQDNIIELTIYYLKDEDDE